MRVRLPSRLNPARALSHDARQIVLAQGLISLGYMGVSMLLRGLFILRLGYGTVYLGTYYATGALVFMAMGVPSGTLGQRWGTRKAMLAGGWLVCTGLLLLSATLYVPDPLRSLWPPLTQVVTVVGWSMFSVNCVPALMLVTSDQDRSSAYSLAGVFRGVGTLVGTLVGGVLPIVSAGLVGAVSRTQVDPQSAPPYAWGLLIGAALGLAALVPLTRVRGGLRPAKRDGSGPKRGAFPTALVAGLVGYVFLRHLGWATSQAYSGPYMDTDLRLPTPTIGLLTSIGQVAAIGATLVLPRLADRWGHGRVLLAATITQIASLALLASFPHWATVGLGLLGIQVSAAVWLPELQVFQMELVEEGWRGPAYGAMAMAMGSGFAVTSYLGGQLIAARGYDTVFALGAAVTVAATVLMAAFIRRAPGQNAESVPQQARS